MQLQSHKDKTKNEPFIADNSCFIGYAATTYDACWKMVKQKMNLIKEQHKWRGVKVEHGVN